MDPVGSSVSASASGPGATGGRSDRRIVLWDNLHANDYDQGRRIYLGPYNRSPSLLASPLLGGILINPNVQYEANIPPLHTVAAYVRQANGYDPATAAAAAAAAWLTRLGAPLELADVELLVDLFWLPYSHGVRGEALVSLLKAVQVDPNDAGRRARFIAAAAEVELLYERLTEITQREACYALYQYMWDIKEELDLLQRHVDWLGRADGAGRRL